MLGWWAVGLCTVGQLAVPRERIEWADIWIADAERQVERRVLLIGDSITRGYYGEVENGLGERASLARLSTSRCVCDPQFFKELDLLLSEYRWDVIHVNNGLHGWAFTEDQYREALRKLADTLSAEAPDSRVVWATTTPTRQAGNTAELSPQNERVIARNAIALDLARERGWGVDDLYGLVIDHPDYHGDDGVHFGDAGRRAQGEQVTAAVLALLGE